MAPRKTLKPAVAPEVGTPEEAPKAKLAKPRTRKGPAPAPTAPSEAPSAAPLEAPVAVSVEAAAASAPKAPKGGRKPKAPKELTPAGTPVADAVAVASPAPAPASAEPAEAVRPEPPKASVAAGDLLTPQARAVLEAIHDGQAVELLFLDAETNPPRTFEPRQLIYDTFAKGWYVWGWDRRYNAERHHRLELLAQVAPVEGMGRAAQGPYKEGTPANLIGGWLGGEPIHVKAVLLKQWIFAVRQAPAPFPEFKLEELEEGKAQVTFVGTDLRAISRWAMQFGDGIQVIEPQRLQDRIKQVGIAWGGKPLERPTPAPAQQAAPKPQQAPRPPRQEQNHKPERRPEHRPERSSEQRSERTDASETATERRPRPEPRSYVPDAPKPTVKAGKIEIRFDRL